MNLKMNIYQGRNGGVYINGKSGFALLSEAQVEALGIEVSCLEDADMAKFREFYKAKEYNADQKSQAVQYLEESKCDQKEGGAHQEQHNQVLDIAIKAIGMQIAKKPLVPSFTNEGNIGNCPNCKTFIHENTKNRFGKALNICGCGQQVDWED